MRHRPYRNQRASWPESPPAAPGRCHPPVGPVSLGPSPPRPAVQGTDGETPSLPEPAGLLARISTSGPRPLPPPGRARVSRAIPTSPDSPRKRTVRHRPYRNQRASWPASPPPAPGRCHPPVGPVSHGPSPPRPPTQETDGETPSQPEPAGLLARISTTGPRPLPPPGRARVSRAILTSPGSPGNGR